MKILSHGAWGLLLVLASSCLAPAHSTPILTDLDARKRGCRDGGLFGVQRLLPQWTSVEASDTPQVIEGMVLKSKISHTDMPTYHTSHDLNFNVQVDPPYERFHSVGSKERGFIEMEWEINFIPPLYWPVEGDRIWLMGRWVFDCGHPPFRTELHPVKALATTRLEPTIIPGDKTPAYTNATFIYLHGRGGYYDAPVGDRAYRMVVPLPTRPSAKAQFYAKVHNLPLGGPPPQLTPLLAKNQLQIDYPLALKDASPNRKFAAKVVAGWREPVLTQGYRTLKVTFDSLKILNSHDPNPTGRWNVFIRAGGMWLAVPVLDKVKEGDILPIQQSVTLTVPENGGLGIQTSGWESDCDDAFRKRDDKIVMATEVGQLPQNAMKCLTDDNDPLGIILQNYTARENFGIGKHAQLTEPSPKDPEHTAGDFRLNYRIEEVARFRPGQSGMGS